MSTFVKYTPQASTSASQVNRVKVNSALYVTSTTDHYLGVDSSLNTVTITLPLSAVAGNGKVIVIKDESGNTSVNNITIAAAGVDTIDTQPSYTMLANFESITVVSDGEGSWFII